MSSSEETLRAEGSGAEQDEFDTSKPVAVGGSEDEHGREGIEPLDSASTSTEHRAPYIRWTRQAPAHPSLTTMLRYVTPVEQILTPKALKYVAYAVLIGGLCNLVRTTIWIPATEIVQIPKEVNCTVHDHDPMHHGMLPGRYQEGFGKAAWHLPKHWPTWLDTQIFQRPAMLSLMPLDHKHLLAARSVAKDDFLVTINQLENQGLSRAMSDLSAESKSMVSCLGNNFGGERISINSSMSLACKSKILWNWTALRNLAIVLSNTENIIDTNSKSLSTIKTLRSTFATARSVLQRLQSDLATKIDHHDQSLSRRILSWDTFSSFDEAQLNKTYSSVQQQYLQLAWLDLTYASLDGVLHLHQSQLSHVTHTLQNFSLHETLASIKHTLHASPLHYARHGIVDTLPYRASLFFDQVRQNATVVNVRGFQHAACRWMHERAPLGVFCKCGEKQEVSRWRVWWTREERKRDWTRQVLRDRYWNLWEGARIWFDDSVEVGERGDEAEVKRRTPDVRMMRFCREMKGMGMRGGL